MTLRDELIRTASRCVLGDRVTKQEVASLLRRAYDRIRELEGCQGCRGTGRNWHSHYGLTTCVECKGSGQR